MKTVFALTILLAGVSIGAAQPAAQFAKANQEYAAGDFKAAIADYEEVLRSGQDAPNLFYNLGNAYFRQKNFGRAILNYERALALDPRHPEAQANLRIARDEARALELILALSILSLSILAIAVAAGYQLASGKNGDRLAVVIAENAEARLATADTAGRVLTLPAGSEIHILSRRGDWIYAALPNNLRGWMPANSAEQVRM
jgi:tetratricopeptide (TPR) repeat protein